MSVYLQITYSFSAIPLQIPMTFFIEIEKKSQNVYETIRLQISTAIGREQTTLETPLFLTSEYTTSRVSGVCLYVVSATWETEVGGSLEPRSLGSVWATK
jgi:hypothetical protein